MVLALFRTESDQRINCPIRTNTQRFCLARAVHYQPAPHHPGTRQEPTVYKYSAKPVAAAFAEAAVAGPQFLDDATPVQVNQPIDINFTTPPGARRLTINVWDRFGEPVRRLIDETDPASGHRSVTWDFTSDARSPLPDGFYIYRLRLL